MNKKWLTLGCFGVLILIFLGGFGYIYSLYASYRNSGGRTMDSGSSQISISIPADGAVVTAGTPVQISATAIGHNPFTFTELLIDGDLAGIDVGPSGGVTPYTSSFTWIPAEPGIHQLITRTQDDMDNKTSSTDILVVVQPPEANNGEENAPADSVDTPANDSPVHLVFPEAAPNALLPVAPPGPSDSVGQSSPWSGSLNNWINSITVDSKPDAPNIAGSLGQCGAILSIHDTSDKEEGFRVFRLGLNSPGWTEVKKLASQSQNDWITYTDSGVSGPINYYVSAFNSQGDSESNIVLVNIDPTGCAEPSEDFPTLTVEIANMILKKPAEQVYCYRSLGGQLWERIPSIGFFTPGENGIQLHEALSNLLLTDLEGKPLFDKIELYLECWGWNGGTLENLGNITHTIDLSNPNDTHIDLESISVDVLVNIGNLNDSENSGPPIVSFPVDGTDLILDPDVAKKLDLNYPIPQASQMPMIQAWITYDPDFCTAHLEPSAQNVLGSLLLCQPYPGFNIGPEGANPQPYLVWTLLNNTCSNGFNEDCYSYDYLLDIAKAKGWKLYFMVEDMVHSKNGSLGFDRPVIQPYRTVQTISDTVHPSTDPCAQGSLRTMRVQMVLEYKPGHKLRGPRSGLVPVPCMSPIGDTIFMEVTFDKLFLSDVDDDDYHGTTGCIGPGTCDDVEAYGKFGAQVEPLLEGGRKFLYFATKDSYCEHPEAIELYQLPGLPSLYWAHLPVMGQAGCYKILGDGIINLAQPPLCESDKDVWPPQCNNEWESNRNSLLILVQDGSDIKLEVKLFDRDLSSSDDPVCVVSLRTESKTLLQWAATSNELHQLQAIHPGFAACTVDVRLNAVTP